MERAGWLCRKEGGRERERGRDRERGREGVRLTLGCHMWPKMLVEIASRYVPGLSQDGEQGQEQCSRFVLVVLGVRVAYLAVSKRGTVSV